MNNDGTHTYNISGTGNITGSGTTLSKQGVGTLILATNNTYGGNTTISGGTVQIGSGGITGSLGTGVTTLSNNAALVFDHSDNPTLSTAVNGAGSLTQMGSGTLIITSSNNYSGSTIINPGGTIQLGNGTGTGNLGITSDVQDNGTLIFNRNNTSSITPGSPGGRPRCRSSPVLSAWALTIATWAQRRSLLARHSKSALAATPAHWARARSPIAARSPSTAPTL